LTDDREGVGHEDSQSACCDARGLTLLGAAAIQLRAEPIVGVINIDPVVGDVHGLAFDPQLNVFYLADGNFKWIRLADPTGALLDQSFVPQNPNVIAGIGGNQGEFAQTFQVGIGGALCRVDVLVANEPPGVPTGNLYFDVRPTINGIPIEDDTAVLASGTCQSASCPPARCRR
jgi:hypothetical protein